MRDGGDVDDDRSGVFPAALSQTDFETIARWARSASGLEEECPDPRELAVALGFSVRRIKVDIGVASFSVNGTLYYAAHNDERETAARVAHALARCILMQEGIDHAERDIWGLMLELLAPRSVTKRVRRSEVCGIARYCPEWALTMRPTLDVAV